MRERSSERKWDCTKRGGASSTPNVDREKTGNRKPPAGGFFVFGAHMVIKVGIVGGTGYTGVELLRLLAQHPDVELAAITSRTEAGTPVADRFPNLRGRVSLKCTRQEEAGLDRCNVVFFATPHGVAMAMARQLVDAGVKIVDLAADFRLSDPAQFEQWYKMPHACPELLAE